MVIQSPVPQTEQVLEVKADRKYPITFGSSGWSDGQDFSQLLGEHGTISSSNFKMTCHHLFILLVPELVSSYMPILVK